MERIKPRLERMARELIKLSLVEGLDETQQAEIAVAYLDREANEIEKLLLSQGE